MHVKKITKHKNKDYLQLLYQTQKTTHKKKKGANRIAIAIADREPILQEIIQAL
jgi:hypothetical protein